MWALVADLRAMIITARQKRSDELPSRWQSSVGCAAHFLGSAGTSDHAQLRLPPVSDSNKAEFDNNESSWNSY